MAPQHTRANLDDIKLEDIEFEVVKECTEKEVVKRYLKLLEDDGYYFRELYDACKDKLLELCPKDYYLLFPRGASAKEIDDITKDLLDWQESVKETDTALRTSKKKKIWDDVPGAGVTAPIRGQEAVVARPNVSRKEEIKDAETKKSGKRSEYARDKNKMKDYYGSWDKFDADAMEEEFDAEEAAAAEARRQHFEDMKQEQDESYKSTPVKTGNLPEGVPEAHRKHMADSEKEKGNEAFYAKDFEEAEAYYTRSLHFRADDPSCWANRALSRLKLENAAGALEDCEHALAINARYMKALHRKGKALYELQRYEEAVQSFQLALMESPGNTQINGDLMHARRKLRSDGAAPPQPKTFAPPARPKDPRSESSCIIEEIVEDEDTATVTAGKAPAAGYTRVEIEEDSEDEEEEEVPINKPGFHKVQIEEASDDSEEGEPEGEPGSGAAPGSISMRAAPAPAPGFQKVQIQEASDSEEDEAPAREKQLATGFHKVQIVDDSDSEDEEEISSKLAATVQSSAPAPEVSAAAEGFDFEGMD
jgi:tetratricopeptide (TPR) repeat protein